VEGKRGGVGEAVSGEGIQRANRRLFAKGFLYRAEVKKGGSKMPRGSAEAN